MSAIKAAGYRGILERNSHFQSYCRSVGVSPRGIIWAAMDKPRPTSWVQSVLPQAERKARNSHLPLTFLVGLTVEHEQNGRFEKYIQAAAQQLYREDKQYRIVFTNPRGQRTLRTMSIKNLTMNYLIEILKQHYDDPEQGIRKALAALAECRENI